MMRLGDGQYRVPYGIVQHVKRHQVPAETVAEWLNISLAQAYRKLAGDSPWTYDELWRFAEQANIPLKAAV